MLYVKEKDGIAEREKTKAIIKYVDAKIDYEFAIRGLADEGSCHDEQKAVEGALERLGLLDEGD